MAMVQYLSFTNKTAVETAVLSDLNPKDLTAVTIYAKLYIQLMYCFYLLITSVKL